MCLACELLRKQDEDFMLSAITEARQRAHPANVLHLRPCRLGDAIGVISRQSSHGMRTALVILTVTICPI